ncbi:MAG: hypothetical protein ABIB46_03865, partial [bacterium]
NLNIFSLYPDILSEQKVESIIVKSAKRNESLFIRYWLNKWKYEIYFFSMCFIENIKKYGIKNAFLLEFKKSFIFIKKVK